MDGSMITRDNLVVKVEAIAADSVTNSLHVIPELSDEGETNSHVNEVGTFSPLTWRTNVRPARPISVITLPR